MKKITIQDDKIKELINQKSELVLQGREVNKQIETLQSDLNKLGLQINKIQDKIVDKFKKHQDKIKLEEFDEITTIVIEKDELIVEVTDRVEEFKEFLRKEKKK